LRSSSRDRVPVRGHGQGSGRAYAAARTTLDEADRVLGRPLTRILFEGPEEELRITWNTQPAILAVTWRAPGPGDDGHGRAGGLRGTLAGEYTALVAAGAMSFGDALRTVEKRGGSCRRRYPSGPARWRRSSVWTRNRWRRSAPTCPVLVLVVELANETARASGDLGARRCGGGAGRGPGRRVPNEPSAARERPVPLLADGSGGQKLAVVLRSVAFSPARSARGGQRGRHSERDAAADPDLLVRQVSSPVLWQDCVKKLASLGVDTFVEVGPGKVLTRPRAQDPPVGRRRQCGRSGER